MQWVLIYLTFAAGFNHATPLTTVIAEYNSKFECEAHAAALQSHISGQVFCGEKEKK